jgi:hypothetical protein
MCSPSLSEGMSAPKAVGPPLVGKDQVLRACVLFTRLEEKGSRPFCPDMRSIGVRGSGTFQMVGMRLIVMPCQVGSAWRGPFEGGRLGLSFGSWKILGSVWCCLLPPRYHIRISGPLPPT